MDRRRFLQRSLVAGAVLAVPGAWHAALADPRIRPLRVQGQVRADGRGLSGVAVTDGLSVVQTDRDGAFTLVSTTFQPFVYLSLPAGYALPTNPTGTARFYQPLPKDAGETVRVRFDLARLPQGDARHTFVALGDTQTTDLGEIGQLKAETVPAVQAALRDLGTDRPAFGVAVGDIMNDHLELFPQYEEAVRMMGVPFFQVVGNHDIRFDVFTDEASTAVFEQHFGPRYYSFNRGAAHYVVLDDVFWNRDGYFGYLDAAQLAWLAQDLALVEAGRLVVVFAHIPVQGSMYLRNGEARPGASVSITNREALYDLLAPYQAHVIAGHMHELEHAFAHGVHEYVVGAACGAWWSGPICYDGTPNGFGVFEVSGETLAWRYQATGLPANHQVRVYPRGADPSAPDEVVANVWDADPQWRVVWYEGSDRRGAMARRTGTDPRSEQLHRGPNLPAKNSWVDPVRTNHLFYAPVAPDAAATVRVEATDRFGRVYTAAVEAG